MEHPIVLFDGACNFCNAGVNFIIDNDDKKIFRFAALQSKAGKKLLKQHGISTDALDTVVLIENGKAYAKSAAALRIMKKLCVPLPLLSALLVVPPFVRNAVYDLIAKNRYKWFGKRDACRVSTAELEERFLE